MPISVGAAGIRRIPRHPRGDFKRTGVCPGSTNLVANPEVFAVTIARSPTANSIIRGMKSAHPSSSANADTSYNKCDVKMAS